MRPTKLTMILFFFCAILTLDQGLAQDENYDYTYVNPGIKIGYTFDRGFTVGFEISYLFNNGYMVGTAAGVDYTIGSGGNAFRVYADAEFGFVLAGFGVGGALFVDEGKIKFARQTIFFAGGPLDYSNDNRWLLGVPYYRIIHLPESKSLKEIGTFLKFSYPVGKGNFGNRYDLGTS